MALLVGVDGCRGGWLCVAQGTNTSATTAWIAPNFQSLLQLSPRPDVVAIDIPIGLPHLGARSCDTEARKLLGRRGSSVFPAPLRGVLSARDYAEASRLRHEAEKKKMSRQAYGILERVREVDAGLQPEHQSWIREVHPEISFMAWNGGQPLPANKKTREGREARARLIDELWPGERARAAEKLGRSGWSHDDLHDAFAALWTARRIEQEQARTVPTTAELDQRNLLMQITW